MSRLEKPSAAVGNAIRACRTHFGAVLGFTALSNLLLLAPTLFMLQIYDRVVPTRGELTLAFLTAALILALATLAILDFARSRILVRASMRLDRQLSKTLLSRSLDPCGSASHAPAEILRDFDTVRQAVTGPAVVALADAPWCLFYILVCTIIHPLLGALALAGAALLSLVTIHNDLRASGLLREANDIARNVYARQEQLIASRDIIRALGMRDMLVARQLQDRSTLTSYQACASFHAGRSAAISKFIRLALQSVSLGLGALLAIRGQISAGGIFAASFLVGRALQPIDQLLGAWPVVTRARQAYARLNRLLATSGEVEERMRLPKPAGRIEVEDVRVSSVNRNILSGISFGASPGEIIAVVGASGSGKSTLLRAIAGALQVDSGTIRIDGASIGDWHPDVLGKHVGFLPQEVSLLVGTIKENIARFDAGGDSDRAVIAAARAAGVHELILRLPNGYETEVSSADFRLSAGQAQRIGLARALYRDPAIIILDEPNAHLDAAGEKDLGFTLGSLKKKGALVLVSAHRLSLLAAADKILILREGKLEAFASRSELLARAGAVADNAPALRAMANG